jgi:hypothetical protein
MKLIPSEEKILSFHTPELLFTKGDAVIIKKEYFELAKIYHPDKNKDRDTNEVFKKLTELYTTALDYVSKGVWITPGLLELKDKYKDTKYQFKYKKHHEFELGDMYINDNHVCYIIEEQYEDFFNNALRVIKGFEYKSDNMKKDISRYLPEIVQTFKSLDNKLGMVIKKTPDLLLLKDVIEYFQNNKFPDVWERHVAWIMSTLHNLTCYFQYANLTHNAISLETFFISPKFHSGALLGGWWYSVDAGKKMIGVPKNLFEMIPPKIKDEKVGNISFDLELIRLLARESFGDKTGIKLLGLKAAPLPMINWIRLTSSGNAFDDYKTWSTKILSESFGPRKFINLELTSDDIYSKEGR